MRNAQVDTLRLWKLWNDRVKPDRICQELGISYTRLRLLARRCGLKGHERLRRPRTGVATPVPSPEEIRERCAIVQAGWSEEERERRLIGRGPRHVECRKFGLDVNYVFSAIDH